MAEGGRVKSEARHVGDGEISNTVEVRGFSKNTSQEVLEMYFENSRRSGGGDVDEVQIVDGVAYITFKEAEVAQRVISHNHHQVDGQTLTVTHPSPPKSYYQNRILIQGLNNAVTEELLKNFLEKVTEAKVREFLYGEEEGNVVVTLSDNIDIGQLRKTFQERRVEGAVLKVSRVAISNCIIVQNLQSSSSHDAILFYFENKRSGGGDVEKVELKAEVGYCLVYFEDHNVIDRVLLKSHNVDGADVEVHLHHECLGRRSSRNKSDPYLRISSLGNKDSSTLEEENTDNQSKDEASSSVSSNPDKESDFVEVQEWQENDGKNCVLPLWIKYKRASERMIIKDIIKIPCSWTFHLYWNFYTKTKQGQQMLDDIVNKYNCSVAVFTEDEDLFIFEIFEKIFDQESDVVHFIHTVLDNVHKCAQQFLHLDILLVDQRMQGDVLQLMKQRKELDGARIELMGQQDNDAMCVVCTEKDKMSVLHVVTEIIQSVRECFENHEEIVSLDHKWQKVMKHFGYIQKLVDKYPKVTIILNETKAASMLKGARDQSIAAANHFIELLGTAQSEVKEDIFSPGCQFEIFTYPEMCDYINNIIMEISIVWIPNKLTKKIHLFSKKCDKIKGIDKFIKGCVQERVYPLPKDQSAHSHERFSSLEKLKKKHTGKIVINPSPTGLHVTTADDIFESVDAAMQEIINKQAGSSVDPFPPPSSKEARPKTKAAPLSPPDQHKEPVKIQGLTAVIDPLIRKNVRKVKKKQDPDKVEQQSEVTISHTESNVQFKAVPSQQHEIFAKETLEIKVQKRSAENSISCDFEDTEEIENVSQTDFLALQSLEIYSKWTQKFNIKFAHHKGNLYVQGDLLNLNEKMKKNIHDEIRALRGKLKVEITYDQQEKEQFRSAVNEAKSDQLLLVWDDNNKQVLVYSDSYDEMQKFKYKVEFKMGKKKITGRRRKMFANEENTMSLLSERETPIQKNITRSFSWSQDATNVEVFRTLEGIMVKVYVANILKLGVDCIVNAANDNLQHDGGVAMVIAKGAGPEIDREGNEILKVRGRIKVGEQCVTTAGNLQYDCIIHTVGPRWSDYYPHNARNTARCDKDLFNSVIGCFFEAENRNLKSIALPTISSEIYAVPRDVCTEQYAKAVIHYSKTRTSQVLQEIHFIDMLPGIIKDMQLAFKRHLSCDGNVKHIVKGGDQTTAFNDCAGRDSGKNHGKKPEKNIGETYPKDEGQTKEKQNPAEPLWPEIEQKYVKKEKFYIYKPNNKIEVNIYMADITKLTGMQVIACSDDRRGNGHGAIASALLQTGNSKYTSIKKKAFQREVHFGDVIITEGGDSNFQLVAHAVLPFKDPISFERHKEMVHKCYDKILDEINKWQKTSLALPLLGAGYAELGYEGSAKLFLDSLEVFCNRTTMFNLKVIHIVYRDEHITQTIADVFIKHTERVRNDLLAANGRELKQTLDLSSQTSSVRPRKEISQVKPMSPMSDEQSKEDCPICLAEVKSPKTLSCGHTFCIKCIEKQFRTKLVCPKCGTIYGDQPEGGKMSISIQKQSLPGFDETDTLIIEYQIPSGTQGPNHPKPGMKYSGIIRTAYLPDTTEGRKVCDLLKVAFERRLIFKISRSSTKGVDYILTWNDIHHKTKASGKYGYPDPGYLKRVQEDLAAKGVTAADLVQGTQV